VRQNARGLFEVLLASFSALLRSLKNLFSPHLQPLIATLYHYDGQDQQIEAFFTRLADSVEARVLLSQRLFSLTGASAESAALRAAVFTKKIFEKFTPADVEMFMADERLLKNLLRFLDFSRV
jgi:hypothetical protein